MRGKVLITSAAMLLAGMIVTAAQQRPQEPRGEDSSRSDTPRGQLSGPDETRGMRQEAPGVPGAATGQSTPQEPRGEESTKSATPRGQQPPRNPDQRR